MALLADLSSKSVNDTVTNGVDVSITISRGAYSDFTVRAGVISGMSNGTALTGSGGIITPSTFDETDLTGDGPEDYIDPHTGTTDARTSTSANVGTKDDQSAPTVTGQAGGSHDTGVVEAISLNKVRFDGQSLKVAHVNGDTVKYICVVTDAGDIVGKYVS
jgi:hypothetical protein